MSTFGHRIIIEINLVCFDTKFLKISLLLNRDTETFKIIVYSLNEFRFYDVVIIYSTYN